MLEVFGYFLISIGIAGFGVAGFGLVKISRFVFKPENHTVVRTGWFPVAEVHWPPWSGVWMRRVYIGSICFMTITPIGTYLSGAAVEINGVKYQRGQ